MSLDFLIRVLLIYTMRTLTRRQTESESLCGVSLFCLFLKQRKMSCCVAQFEASSIFFQKQPEQLLVTKVVLVNVASVEKNCT